jgi:hypothetical protein
MTDGQLQFGEQIVQTPAQETKKPANPALVEFVREGVKWRCARFDLLAAEFEMTPADLPLFVDAAQVTERGWLIARRLFGIQPMVPPLGTPLEDLRPWSRVELQETLGLTRNQLNAELGAVRGAWRAVRPAKETPAPEAPAAKPGSLFSEDDLLEKHGLVLKFGSSAERTWFCQRVQDYEKVLAEKFATVLARNALLTELRIYQLDSLLNDPEKGKTGDKAWHENLKVRQTLAEQYQKLLDQIKTLCPWAGAIAGKYAFAGAIADITKGIQAYKARGDTALIDGMCTLTEVFVDCRMSVQAAEPAYRADIRVLVAEAKAHLWDYKWQSQIPLPALRHVQAGWKQAFMAAAEADGKKLPDLSAEGPDAEHDDLPDVTRLVPAQQSNHEQSNTEAKPQAG